MGIASGMPPVGSLRTSSFMIRPSLPVGITSDLKIPFSAIIFLADGASSISIGSDLEGLGSCLAIFDSCSEALVICGIAPSLTFANKASTLTVEPSTATISVIIPFIGLGTSTVTLSVSNSQSISSNSTGSPTFLNHVAIVASVTDSPKVGTRTSVDIFYPFNVSASSMSAACCDL